MLKHIKEITVKWKSLKCERPGPTQFYQDIYNAHPVVMARIWSNLVLATFKAVLSWETPVFGNN